LIVGHAILRQPSFSTLSQSAAELSRLFVTPAARRKGIATALMQATMRWAAAKELDLELEVTDHLQAARALYERSGFRLIDTKEADWTTPSGAPVTLHHYAWSRERSLMAAQKVRAPPMWR
jgi:GNAT superfamily N-acetyltransferase